MGGVRFIEHCPLLTHGTTPCIILYLIVFNGSTSDEHQAPCHTGMIIATASELGQEAIKMDPKCFGMDLSQL